MQEPPCLLPQLGVGFGEREDVNQTRMVARGLQLCPQPGAAVLPLLGARGAHSVPDSSRWLLGRQGPGMSCGTTLTPERLLAAPLDASCMGTPSGPQHPLPMEADAGTADFSHFPGFKSTKVDLRLQKFHSWDCRPLLPQESSRPLTSPALLHPFPAVRRDVGATSSGLPYNFWGPLEIWATVSIWRENRDRAQRH